MKYRLVKESSFYKAVLALGLPIAMQNLITQATSMMDSVMLGAADPTGELISAASLANQPFFILSIFCFGLASGSAVLASQYWGKKDCESIRTIISMIMKVAVFISFLFATAVLLFPLQVMGLFSSNPTICAYGADYLRIIGFAYILFGFGSTLLCSLRSIEIVHISVLVNAVSFVTNVFLNWVLIFGNLGMPALGIKGAAIATLIARIVEFLITVIYIFFIDKRLAFRFKHFFLFDGTLARDLLRHGTPVVINELMWALAISVQAAILGHITYSQGDPVAANTVAGMVQQLATVFIIGLGSAAAVLVGKSIGEGKKEEALNRSYTLEIISIFLGILSFFVIILLQSPVISLYSLQGETMQLARDLIVVVAVVCAFSSVSCTLIMGVLRGGGDTRFCLLAEILCLWGVAIPAALLGSYLQLPVPIVLCLMKVDEVLKCVVCIFRLKFGNWMRALTRERAGKNKFNA